MLKVKLSSATKIKAIEKDFEEFTVAFNLNLYCQVWCCIVHEKRFCVEQQAVTWKGHKGIEKRKTFFGHTKSFFLKNEVTLSSVLAIWGHKRGPTYSII